MAEYFTPGDYKLKELTLVNYQGDEYDIRGLFVFAEMFESLLSTSLSLNIVILDSIGLAEFFPIIGKERLKLRYATDDSFDDVVVEMVTYQLPNKTQHSRDSQQYTLNFVSDEFIHNQNTTLRRSMKGDVATLIGGILSNELSSDKKFVVRQNPITNISYIPVRQRPFEACYTILNRAISPSSADHTDYLLYETVDGFAMDSLNDLVTQPTAFTYKFASHLNQPDADAPIKDEFFVVGDYVINQETAQASSIASGMYGGTLGVFDPITRAYKESTYDYSTDKGKYNFLSSELLVPNNDAVQSQSKNGYYKYVIKGTKDESYLHRNAKLEHLFNGVRVTVDVPGNSKLRVGQIIELELPTTNEIGNERFLSGKYLLSSIKHCFAIGQGSYRSVIELVKDSVNYQPKPLLEKLPKK